MRYSRRSIIAAVCLSAAVLMSACSAEKNTAQDNVQEFEKAETVSAADTPVQGNASVSGAGTITLSAGNAEISGKGAEYRDGAVTITAAGDYVITGSAEDMQIIVDAGKDAKVKLVLNGVSIRNSYSPLYIMSADKTVIELAAGSENILEDTGTYDDTMKNDACIYSADDIKIKGEGGLTVTAMNHGIHSKNDIEIESGSIYISSLKDAVKGKDSVQISGGMVTVTCAGDGISSDNSEEDGKGTVSVSGGDICIVSSSPDQSCKGIKAADSVNISGGSFNINSMDDCIHSDKDVLISGGSFELSSGDDGIHADETLTISGGNGFIGGDGIKTAKEGFEGTAINLSGGNWSLTTSDDGINCSGGDSRDMFAVNEDSVLSISGGSFYINAGGDGLDSNGNVVMTGGTVFVDGPTNSGNGALDYNGTFLISGGTLGAAGSVGMAQAVSDGSVQKCLAVYFTEEQSEGTKLTVKNGSDEVYSFIPAKRFQSMIISFPELADGMTFCVNDKEMFTTALTGTVTSVNENGEEAQQAGFGHGGQGGFGGGKQEWNGERPEGGRPDWKGDPDSGERPQRPDKGDRTEDFPQFDGMTPPDGFAPPEGVTPSDGTNMSENGGNPPDA